MIAASMQYEGAAGPESGATAVRWRLCGITDTTTHRARPFKIKISYAALG